MVKRCIKEEKQGYYTKLYSWFNNKEIQLAVYKFISFPKNKLLAQKLAKAIKNHLGL